VTAGFFREEKIFQESGEENRFVMRLTVKKPFVDAMRDGNTRVALFQIILLQLISCVIFRKQKAKPVPARIREMPQGVRRAG
jgi:hypothetical protein